MKRIILVTLFLSFFGFTPALASWEDSINNLPQTVPWEWNNTTFTHIAMYNYIPGYVLVAVYCPSATSITADYNYGALAIRSTADNTCRMFESDDNGATWLTNHWPFTYARNNQTPTSNLGDFIRSNRNVTATYTENWYGAWEFNSVTAGDRLIDGSSFGGFIVTKNLNITRSPELGGGVIVTVPPGFPEFQCGTDGQEECDFDVDYNAQVTLEAQPNAGYAFSHWEINSATMGDTDGTITIAMSEDKDVVAVFRRVLGWPLDGTPSSRTILSGFGADWLESCSGEVMKHTGIDIGATTTDVVYAAKDGVVKVAQTDQQWGGWVTIEHDSLNNPFTTTYIHITPSVSYNDPVEKGDSIGTVVNYGGPLHLHFGLRNGSYNNTSNRGRLPQSVCGGDPAFQENFENPSDFLFE